MGRLEQVLARPQGFGARALDGLLAACLALTAIVLFGGTHRPFPAVVIAVAGSAAVATRRSAPALSILAVAVTSLLISATDHGVNQLTQGIAAALCFYSLGSASGPRISARDIALLAGALPVGAVTPPKSAGATIAAWLFFVALPYVGARIVDSRVRLTEALEANSERSLREQEMRARQAAADERSHIARELHDVIAHSLSVMVIQTVAAREIAPADEAAARAALASVRSAGREALLEMRRMIGVLRCGDVELAGTAAPGIDQLDLLAQRARTSGLPVRLELSGRRRELPEALDLVAFRIIQEALTNSIKHAGAAQATVTVTFGPAALELEICDDGLGSQPGKPVEVGGHGLVGMRERIALFGGELQAGRQPEGGFRVYARLPIDVMAAA